MQQLKLDFKINKLNMDLIGDATHFNCIPTQHVGMRYMEIKKRLVMPSNFS